MKHSERIVPASAFLLGGLMLFVSAGRADDWPMYGRDTTRNAISREKGPPLDWHLKNAAKWSVQLGSLAVGSPIVANGLVWIGTNNAFPRDAAFKGDAGVLMCFRASDGRFLYQYVSPRLSGPKLEMWNDWPHSALACTPLVEGDRLWFTTNRCEVVCLAIGALQHEGGRPQIVWKVDMIKELGVFPQTAPMALGPATSIGATYKDLIYVATTNGVAEDSGTVPAPDAPGLVCFQKDTGKIIWQDHSPGKGILEGQWASPLVVEIGGRGQVIAPQGDGWVRSFDALTGKLLWKCDTNPKEAKWGGFGRGTRNSILATPVYHEGRVYIANGLNLANHGPGPGWLYCLDPTKEGDISLELEDGPGKGKVNLNSGVVWRYGGPVPEDQRLKLGRDYSFGRTQSTCVIQDGLVYAVDLDGYFHCLDARTGKKYWEHDLQTDVLGSPCWLDGKIYLGTHDGDVWIFAHGKEKKEPRVIDLDDGIHGAPVFSNGVLYVAAGRTLHAIQGKQDQERGQPTAPGYWPQWRGPDRTNASQEKGLLQQWPADGPPLLWKAAGLGEGIAPVSVAGGRIYTSGYHEGGEFAIALDEQSGQRLWAAYLGASVPEHALMRWLSQRAVTVDDERLYYVTAAGELVCLQVADGKELWRKGYPRDFGARRPAWSFCDCPLIDGDRLICTPGAAEAPLVSLNKKTGEVIWKAVVPGDSRSGYAPLMVADVGGIRQYVAFLGQGLVGVAAKDGKLLWHYDRIANRIANSHTPLVRGDLIFCANGYSTGIVLLKLVPANQEIHVEEQYFQKFRVSSIQDSSVPVLVGDYAYDFGSTGMPVCIEMKTGKLLWEAKAQSRQGRGSLTYADGHLYVRSPNGVVTLVVATPKEYVEKGAFKVPTSENALGSTAPVIAGRRLFLRANGDLLCYDIRSSALEQPRREPRSIVLPPPGAPKYNLRALEQPRAGTKRAPDAIFVPTPQDVVEQMLELAKGSKKDVVYDLGSGDGRVVITAAKKYGCKAVGYEIDPELVELSRQEVRKAHVQDLVRIEHEDIFTQDLSGADVIAVYLSPRVLQRLLPQLEKLKPGARIVSHYFEIPGIKADMVTSVVSKEDGNRHTLYLWTVPFKKGN